MRDASDPAGKFLVIAYAFYAMVAAALFAINTPPYQNPDETNQFLRADSVARGHLLGRRIAEGTDFGGIASPEIARSGAAFDWPKVRPERKVTAGEYRSAFAKFGEPGVEITFPNTAVYPPTLYAPTVVALWIGKASRMSVVQTLYAARLLNALAAAVLIAAGLTLCLARGADGAALAMFAVATLPMAFSVASAVSQDGPMLGVAAVAAALLVRLRQAPSSAGLVGLSLRVGVLAMARPPYVCLALLPLAARGRWGARLAAGGVAAGSCAIWTVVVSRIGHVSVATNNADLSTQLSILWHPARLGSLLLNTFTIYWWEYLEQMIGRLGWLEVTLPTWYINATMVGLLACLALVVRPFDWRGLVVACGVAGSALAVVVLIYLTWTAVARPVVEGVQGRYFLPLAMVLCGLGTRLPRPMLLLPFRAAVLLWPVISIGVAVRVLVVRFYLGE